MKRILAIIGCSLILTVAFLSIKAAAFPLLTKNAEFGFSRLCHDDNITTVFLGSSMFRQGIDTRHLTSDKDKAFLLAYNGNQPWMEYRSVQNMIRNGKKPKNLVVDMYAYSVNSNVFTSDIRFFMDSSPRRMIENYSVLKKEGSLDLKETYEMFVSSNNEWFITWPLSYPLINRRYDNGSNTSESAGLTERQMEKLHAPYVHNPGLNEFQKKNINDLMELCREQGITMILLETPKYQKTYDDQDYLQIMTAFYDLAVENGNCTVIVSDALTCAMKENRLPNTVRTYSYGHSETKYFTDYLHLSSDGRKMFTETVRPILTDILQ